MITIGKITSGTVQNIIAEHARLEGTIRAFTKETMENLQNRILDLVKGIEIGFQCEAIVDFGAMYHQVYNHEKLTKEFMDFVSNQQMLMS